MRLSFVKSTVFAAAIAACGLVASAAHAQSFTALYDYTGNTGTEANEAVVTQPSGANIGVIARGSGITANAGGGSLNSAGFSQTTIDLNDYYGFTITPNAGNKVSLTTLAYLFQRSATGPSSFSIRSSVDGFGADLFTTTDTGTTGLSRTFDLSGVASLQNLTTATTLRIYGYASGGTAGTFRLNSTAAGTGTTISGTVAPVGTVVPEASSFVLIVPALGVLGAVVARRRKLA